MSIKTLRKRIALVAVASLGFGLMSVVPANAANWTAWKTYQGDLDSINLKLATATPTTGSAVYVNVGAVETSVGTDGGTEDGGTAGGAVTQLRAALETFPSGGFASVAAATSVEGATAGTPTTPTGSTINATSNILSIRDTDDAAGLAAYSVTATATTGIGSFFFTPSKAGTYVLKVWNDGPGATATTVGNNAADSNEAVQTLSITVVAAATYSNTLSTAYIFVGSTATAPTATTTAAQSSVTATKGGLDATNDNAAAIDVVIKDSSNNALATGNSLTAEITGPGYLRWVNEAVDADNCATAPTFGTDIGRSLGLRSIDAQSALYVCADGTAGTATITVKVTDVNDVVYTLATRTVVFFGAVTKLTASPQLTVGRVAGASATGVSVADRDLATEVPSVIIKATDAAGNPVSGLTITAKSSNTGVMSETITVNEDVLSTANIYSSGGRGFYNISITASTGAKSGDKATVTYRVVDPAGDGTTYLTAAVDYTIGGSVATETLSFDKASYAPGEAMVITRTAKDSSGNPVYDGAASPAITFTKSVGGTAPAAGIYVGGVSKSSTSAATAGVFAPITSGAFSATATSGATGSPTITASSSVATSSDLTAIQDQMTALVAAIAKLQAAIAKINKRLKR